LAGICWCNKTLAMCIRKYLPYENYGPRLRRVLKGDELAQINERRNRTPVKWDAALRRSKPPKLGIFEIYLFLNIAKLPVPTTK